MLHAVVADNDIAAAFFDKQLRAREAIDSRRHRRAALPREQNRLVADGERIGARIDNLVLTAPQSAADAATNHAGRIAARRQRARQRRRHRVLPPPPATIEPTKITGAAARRQRRASHARRAAAAAQNNPPTGISAKLPAPRRRQKSRQNIAASRRMSKV